MKLNGVWKLPIAATVAAITVAVPTLALAAAPANDNFASAEVIPGAGGVFPGTNFEATAETGEPDHAASTFGAVHSIWWEWTAPAAGETTVSTCGSEFNTASGSTPGRP